jgi:hypothetical protein
MTLSSFHLTSLSTCHGGINECRKFLACDWNCHLWHNFHTKFNEFLFIHFLVIKCVDLVPVLKTLGQVRFGPVRLGC